MVARLVDTPHGLGLVDDDAPDLSPLVLDFTAPRQLSKKDDLIKALGWEKGCRHVVDATGGLGRDAAAMAHYGFTVRVFERAPLMQRLWDDALTRHTPPRLRFVAADAVAFLGAIVDDERPEVVYLDPMYPPQKQGQRKALQQRELRLIKAAVDADPEHPAVTAADNLALFTAARFAATRRVVVKRPRWAAPIVDEQTVPVTHRYEGTSTHFDLYVVGDRLPPPPSQ